MLAISLKRRLARLENRYQPRQAAPPTDLSKLNESEITFLCEIESKTPVVNGKLDIATLTNEELDALESIVLKLDSVGV